MHTLFFFILIFISNSIIRNLITDKAMSMRFGKPLRTRNNNKLLRMGILPKDPMRAPDPRPGNAMHISPSRKLGYM